MPYIFLVQNLMKQSFLNKKNANFLLLSEFSLDIFPTYG